MVLFKKKEYKMNTNATKAEILGGREPVDFDEYEEFIKILSPIYPMESLVFAKRFASGETPVQLSGGILTKAEAHEWLLKPPQNITMTKYLLDLYLPSEDALAAESWANENNIRWLIACFKDSDRKEALTKKRIIRDGAEEFETSFLSRLDEITKEDLVYGVKTGVVTAFENAEIRQENESLKGIDRDAVLREPFGWWKDSENAVALTTAGQLVKEGREMNHCVKSLQYINGVKDGEYIIVSVRVNGKRSTCQITSVGNIIQHQSRFNSRIADETDEYIKRYAASLLNDGCK